METTALGNIEGYTPHEVKERGTDLRIVSDQFYRRVIELTEGKEVIYRVVPYCKEDDEGYYFYTRVYIRNDQI